MSVDEGKFETASQVVESIGWMWKEGDTALVSMITRAGKAVWIITPVEGAFVDYELYHKGRVAVAKLPREQRILAHDEVNQQYRTNPDADIATQAKWMLDAAANATTGEKS